MEQGEKVVSICIPPRNEKDKYGNIKVICDPDLIYDKNKKNVVFMIIQHDSHVQLMLLHMKMKN